MSHANPIISELRDRIQRLEGGSIRKAKVLAFGIADIDERLPGGGLGVPASRVVLTRWRSSVCLRVRSSPSMPLHLADGRSALL